MPNPIFLLDANVLIALTVREHASRDRAHSWFEQTKPRFATCPITQGGLIRFHYRESESIQLAKQVLRMLTAHERHEFWHDDLSYLDVEETGLRGHKQVTDYYLAALARSKAAKLVTFDTGLAAAHPTVCVAL